MKRNCGFGKEHPSAKEKKNIIKAYEKGMPVKDISDLFSYHPMTIYRWIREAKMKATFERKSNPGSGRFCKIDERSERKLIRILKKPATKLGFETSLWNTKRLQIVCKKELKINISRVSVWKFLKKIKYSCKKVQGIYKEADPKKQDQWRRKIVKLIQKTVEKNKAILYFEDESNIALSPVMGTSWSPRGELIKAKVSGKRGSVAAISAISNDGRLIFSLHNSGKRF